MKEPVQRVGYTYFLREPVCLQAALDHIDRTTEAQIWCAGVSTGEEAYSYALLAREREQKVRIFATDVDEASIQVGRGGHFPARAARRVPESLRQRWFTPTGEYLDIAPELRRMVRFEVHDVRNRLPDVGTRFDLVSCRHVFLYLSRSEVEQALRHVRSVLTPKGVLVLGAAERLGSSTLRSIGFQVVHVEGATLYRPAPIGGLLEDMAWETPFLSTRPRFRTSFPVQPVAEVKVRPPERTRGEATIPGDLRSQGDRQLDLGTPKAALALYESALEVSPLAADLHLRVAVCLLALDHPEDARVRLRRALFLDPDCWPAALVLAELGGEQAERYLRQAEAGLRNLGNSTPPELEPFIQGRGAAMDLIRQRLGSERPRRHL